MRDNHQGLPEIIEAIERDGSYFGVVSVMLGDETRSIEFGLTLDCYRALKQVLQMRPFDKMPGISYRYFVVHSFSRNAEPGVIGAEFRIEQGSDAKQFAAKIPESLAANLRWFCELRNFDAVSHLRVVSKQKSI